MTDTIRNMDYIFVDKLRPDQVMEGDLLEFEDEYGSQICEVTNIEEFKDFDEGYAYLIAGKNDYHEIFEIVVRDSQFVKLFVLK